QRRTSSHRICGISVGRGISGRGISRALVLSNNCRRAPAALSGSNPVFIQQESAVISRRAMVSGSLIAAPVLLSLQADADDAESELQRGLTALERRHGGRLGVAILNSASSKLITQRGDERFALCSTFKFLAAAFVLMRVDRGQENLGRRVVYSKNDL